MSEAEWLGCTDPESMLEYLRLTRTHRKDWRKYWLFSCACCRRIWHLLDERCQNVVEVGERYADGECLYNALIEASEEAFCQRTDLVSGSIEEAAALATFAVVVDPSYADNMTPRSPAENAWDTTQEIIEVLNRSLQATNSASSVTRLLQQERIAQANLLRCIFGNPVVTTKPISTAIFRRLTQLVPNLAEAIYEERAFDRMTVLGDALEDAGCTDDALLSHLRSPGPHYRGCWALDAILCKK